VTFAALRGYYRRARIPVSRRWWLIALIVCGYLTGQVVLVAALLPIATLDDEALRAIFAGVVVATSAYAAFLLVLIRRNEVRRVRLDVTARTNGFGYRDRLPTGLFAGSPMQSGRRPEATDVLSQDAEPSGLRFSVGTFPARPGFSFRRAGFIQVPLERETPHIVLENRHSAVLRSTGARVRRGQRLGLEGDFDRTFSLSCPAGYERDALYIFTPDLMALLLDVAPDCEVELIDGVLLLYTAHPWHLWRPERFARAVLVAEVVGAKVRRRTAAYRDDRSANLAAAAGALRPIIAQEGRRLRTRPTIGTVLAIAYCAASAVFAVVSFLPH
jgi:hypothetical protein